MPRYRRDCAPDRLFEMLRDPPVVLLFEIADGDEAGAGANSEFRLRRGPADAGGSTIDAEKDQSRLPAFWRRFPYVGVTVCGMSVVGALS